MNYNILVLIAVILAVNVDVAKANLWDSIKDTFVSLH